MEDTDLAAYTSETDGRPTDTTITSGAAQNVFKHVTSAQRKASAKFYTKIYFGIKNTDNVSLITPAVKQFAPTSGDLEFVLVWPSAYATAKNDTALAAELTSSNCFGSAYTSAAVSTDDQTIDVTVKDARLLPGGTWPIFRAGMTINITDLATASSTSGNEEELTIDTVTATGTLAARITTVETISADYASGAKVQGVISLGDTLEPTVTDPTLTGVTWDTSAKPVEVDNKGTILDTFTGTFSDTTNFIVAGASYGGCGAGTISTEFAPSNSNVTRPLFTIAANSITAATAGSTFVFSTTPAKAPIGEVLVIPAGTASLANNSSTLVFNGESEAVA